MRDGVYPFYILLAKKYFFCYTSYHKIDIFQLQSFHLTFKRPADLGSRRKAIAI